MTKSNDKKKFINVQFKNETYQLMLEEMKKIPYKISVSEYVRKAVESKISQDNQVDYED